MGTRKRQGGQRCSITFAPQWASDPWRRRHPTCFRRFLAALCVTPLAGCAAVPGAVDPSPAPAAPQQQPSRDARISGAGYWFALPKGWSPLSAEERRQLGVKGADLAVADGHPGCATNALSPWSTSGMTVQRVAVSSRTAPVEGRCSLPSGSSMVTVSLSPHTSPLSVSGAEEQLRGLFRRIAPGTHPRTSPRIMLDQIESAHVVAMGHNRAAERVQVDGVAYHIGTVYLIVVVQRGDASVDVGGVLRSWRWS